MKQKKLINSLSKVSEANEREALLDVQEEIIRKKLPSKMAKILNEYINGEDVQKIAEKNKCSVDDVNSTVVMGEAAVFHYLDFCKKTLENYKLLSCDINFEKTILDNSVIEKLVVNDFCRICTDLSAPRALTHKRKAAIKKAQQVLKKQNLTFEELFKIVQQSDFLCGRIKTGRNWKADFDFVLNENNIMKIIEGKYDNEITCRGGISSKPTYNLGQIKQDALNNTEIKYN